MPEYETILYRESGAVATISFNRPEKRNALNTLVCQEAAAAVNRAEANDDIRCMVLTGEGSVFCAGQDLKFTLSTELEEYVEYGQANLHLRSRLQRCDKPVIARVQGDALGGGTYMAAACDLVVAVKTARFALREINAGVQSGGALMFTIGRARSLEMSLLGRYVTGEEAERWNLINRAVEPEDLDSTVAEWVDQLTSLPPLGLKYTKKAANLLLDMAGFQAHLDARVGQPYLFLTEDNKEAKRAVLEKRRPKFVGR